MILFKEISNSELKSKIELAYFLYLRLCDKNDSICHITDCNRYLSHKLFLIFGIKIDL